MNYETSRLVRRLKLPQGIVRRMSVSVLVDHNVRWEAAKGKGATPKKIIEAPSPDTMKIIHDVVAAAAGFNANRGDQLTVNSLPFEATLLAEPPASLSSPASPRPGTQNSLWTQRPVLIGAAVVLLVGLLSLFLLVQSRKRTRAVISELQKQLQTAQAQDSSAGLGSPSTENRGTSDSTALGETDSNKQLAAAREGFRLPQNTTTKAEVLTRQVTEEVRKDPVALAQIVRTWLNESNDS